MRSSILLQFALLAPFVLGHPEPDVPLTEAQLIKKRLAAQERHLAARNCASQISDFTNRRREKRSLARRAQQGPPAGHRSRRPAHGSQAFIQHTDSTSSTSATDSSTTSAPDTVSTSATDSSSTSASSTSTANTPHYTEIQNFTCITAPEVTEGPYYINNEIVRQNLIEDQAGVKLVIDVGVLDTTTCQPLSNAFVEIWAANATGVYGGYPATLDFGGGGPPPDNTTTTTSDTTTNTDTTTSTDSTTSTATPTGPPGGGGPGGPGGASIPLARNETFLRGGLATDANGIVELITLYPGFYQGRTAHIHAMVHLNYEQADNGTIISHAGSLLHIGQFFFDESWNDQVYATDPYTTNTNNRTLNSEDSILDQANADGNNAFLALELLGDDISEGILGYITVGVNSSASYNISNTNYLNSTTTTDETSTSTASFIARAMAYAGL